MHVDSAIMKTTEGSPVIGLTLRNDSLDSFWFSVLHSVAHIWKHLSEVHYFFVNDFDIKKCHCNVDWSEESEADQIALKVLIEQRTEITLDSESYSHTAKETIKLASNSRPTKGSDDDPSLTPITSPVKAKPLRDYFL